MDVRKKRYILFVLAMGLVVTNILLIQQNWALRSALEERRASSLKVGERVSSFAAVDLTGKNVQVGFAGSGPTRVLLYLATDCHDTDIQFAYWCRVIAAADPERFEFVGVVDRSEAPDEVLRYLNLRQCRLSEKVLRFDSELANKYQLSITPTTLMVDADGTVRRIWSGLWRREDVQDALRIVTDGFP